jgi:hypothetical protein
MPKSTKKAKPATIKGTPIPTPRLLLAIDPAAAAGAALFVDGQLVSCTPADGTSFTAMLQTVRPLLASYGHITERVVVLEQHWMSFHSQKGSMTLGQRRGIAQSVGEALGCTRWFYVPSATWQSHAFDGTKPEDTKSSSIRVANALWPHIQFPTDDCSDAALIGNYFINKCTTH